MIFQKELIKTLESVYESDQRYRNEYTKNLTQEEYNDLIGTDEFKDIQKKQAELDSINLLSVENILAEYGWLSEEKVGYNASQAIFLVLQHSSLKIQKKYLHLFEKAFLNGELDPSNYALFVDRILVREGKSQLYGTQVEFDYKKKQYCLCPTVKGVNKRRLDLGLTSIDEYLTFCGINYSEK